MVRALGNLPRETDGRTVDEGVADEVKIVSSKTTGIVDGPGSEIGGNSSSGDEDKNGETIGIVGKLLDFDEVEESGDMIASNEREMLLGFDDCELEEGSGSVTTSSAIGPKMGGIGSGDSERSARIEGEPEPLDGVGFVWLKLPCREC